MGRQIIRFPRDPYLSHRKMNDVSSWIRSNDEWEGVREKFILSPPNSKTQYMVKFPNYGPNETKIELFNCCLGLNLNLDIAYYFPCTYMNRKGLITRSFLKKESELWRMKDLICRYSRVQNLKEMKGRDPSVLEEHNIDNIYMILEDEFGKDKLGNNILKKFFKMIGFDCLLGHGDRHWSNYGVLVFLERVEYIFAPIYDTASGYLLELPSDKLRKIIAEGKLETEEWHRPMKKGICKITFNNNFKANHVDLFEYILDSPNYREYITALTEPIRKFRIKLVRALFKNSFYLKDLSKDRKFSILKTLEMRQDILNSVLKKRGLKND